MMISLAGNLHGDGLVYWNARGKFEAAWQLYFFAARFGALASSCDGKLGCLRLVS
jgi:hypothetical protein